jgi:peroxiredoxin
MASYSRLLPRTKAPQLSVSTVDGPAWDLHAQRPETFTMVVFYRGLHCPICKTYLGELNRLADEFAQRGVNVIALSSDSQERAETTKRDWKLDAITIGYGLSIEAARSWNLYISTSRGMTSIGVEEPATFSEPGLFLIKPDGTLYYISTQSMPFARPGWRELLAAIDFVVAKDYPARGELAAAAEHAA